MDQPIESGLRTIRRALISVSNKSGVVELARVLQRFDVEIISTGGTATVLREAGIEVRDIAEVTGFPEMMDGRVKTLHPAVHGALLALRDNREHKTALAEHNINPIDMVVVNLYPFEETVAKPDVSLEEAIEQIDIGGPAMIRSAAKNFRDVAVLTTAEVYKEIISELDQHRGALTLDTRARLARLAFRRTSSYDAAVCRYLESSCSPLTTVTDKAAAETTSSLPAQIDLSLTKISDLRYGENPHQQAALYEASETGGVAHATVLSGKEMSFNNYVDADAAWQLVSDFEETTCAIIKHTNPAGVGAGATAAQAYRKALATDPVSAFGGIVAFNCKVDKPAAEAVTEIFTEVVIAPDYDPDAIGVLQGKKNLRVLKTNLTDSQQLELRIISGGMLLQTRDVERLNPKGVRVVTRREPTADEWRALLFAWTVCKHTKSNAIVYAVAGQTVGVGAGQMSRVDSVKIGAMRALLPLKGSVLASDAFFPFRDGLDEAAKHGITAVIQPGGSVRDQEVIQAADEHNLAMIFTGVRHFKH